MSAVCELDPPKADADLLATIDRLREQAVAGKLLAFAYVAVERDSTTYETGGDRMRALAGVSRLEHFINKAIDERRG